MEPSKIQIDDLRRILSGQEAWSFYLELLLRAAIVYAVILLALRFIGKRMSSQMSRTELATLVSLAAAIGVPLLSPERGLLAGLVVAVIVVLIARLMARLSRRSVRFEKAAQGYFSILVDEGRMQPEAMRASRISRERLLSHLRSEAIHQLGLVQRLYLEANGTFSLVRQDSPRPGLSLIPDWDERFVREQRTRPDHPVCSNCGERPPATARIPAACPNCGATVWVPGIE